MSMHTWFECKSLLDIDGKRNEQRIMLNLISWMHSALQKQKHALLRR